MSTEENKNIESLIDKLMYDDKLSSTSTHFTNSIMDQVEILQQQKILKYKPLISKKLWMVICSVIASVFAYFTFYGDLSQSKWFDYFKFNLSLNLIPELNFSNTTIYAITIVSVLFLVQIIILKNYFNKRLSV